VGLLWGRYGLIMGSLWAQTGVAMLQRLGM